MRIASHQVSSLSGLTHNLADPQDAASAMRVCAADSTRCAGVSITSNASPTGRITVESHSCTARTRFLTKSHRSWEYINSQSLPMSAGGVRCWNHSQAAGPVDPSGLAEEYYDTIAFKGFLNWEINTQFRKSESLFGENTDVWISAEGGVLLLFQCRDGSSKHGRWTIGLFQYWKGYRDGHTCEGLAQKVDASPLQTGDSQWEQVEGDDTLTEQAQAEFSNRGRLPLSLCST